jgi:alkaline phosphatase D
VPEILRSQPDHPRPAAARSRAARDLTRRRFVAGGASLGVLAAAPAFLRGLRAAAEQAPSALFTLGVASGDPGAHSVVLWTRLAPEPLAGGGLGERIVPVKWQIALDPGMRRVIRDGVARAHPKNGHAVHALASGLPPDRWLYYRFHALGEASRIGRTRTFPARRGGRDHMRFAVVSCQSFPDGFYRAYADLNRQELDFVVHVGDYIYEGGAAASPFDPARNHIGAEIVSIDDYRNRYALYRLDPDLQEAHALFPFIVTPDDHEVDNNYAGEIPELSSPTQGEAFLARRRNAYQVYAESMPLRPENRRLGEDGELRLFRSLPFGDLARLHVLDTRQFRSDQPAGDGFGSTDPDSAEIEFVFGEQIFDAEGILDPAATLMGVRQEDWLHASLTRSRATWNVLAQQVMQTRWNLVGAARVSIEQNPAIGPAIKQALLQQIALIDEISNVDAWDGYPAARQRLFDLLVASRASNPIVLTGDIHSAWGANLLADFSDASSQIVAAEFVSTSISSSFGGLNPRPTHAVVRAGLQPANPHIAYFNGLYRGYCLCDVDRTRWQTTFRAVGTSAQALDPSPTALVPLPTSPVETDAVLEIAAGFNEPGRNGRIETTFARPIPI